ncbi:HDOD domain-containing protein [Ideonella sp. NS12-5]|uniref:HDOD domain-containing protein n=2 Tax=Ideonella oryzae TaxID=2937441 RepID=A0ABT1BNE3_9BURK|nr:HDOD domain-containing protein [Ideonella oryzae]
MIFLRPNAMWSPLQQLQKAWSRPAPEPRPVAPARPVLKPAATVAPAVPAPVEAVADPDLDRRFVGELLQVAHWEDTPPSGAERDTLRRLAALVIQPQADALVPRRPTALPRLLGLMQDENASARELAALVAQDPALLGEVMRLANSVQFRGERRVESLEQAVMMLGQWGLRQLVTRALMTPVFSARQGRFAPRANPRLWDEAARCAHGCAWLTEGDSTRFDAYLAGMVVDTGMIAALRVMDQVFPPQAQAGSQQFLAALLPMSARLSVGIARQWQLPAPVIEAIAAHAERCADPGRPPAAALATHLDTAIRCARRLLLKGSDSPKQALPAGDMACQQELERAFCA